MASWTNPHSKLTSTQTKRQIQMETLNHILTIPNHVHGDLSLHSSSLHRKRTKFHEQKTARREICETQFVSWKVFFVNFAALISFRVCASKTARNIRANEQQQYDDKRARRRGKKFIKFIVNSPRIYMNLIVYLFTPLRRTGSVWGRSTRLSGQVRCGAVQKWRNLYRELCQTGELLQLRAYKLHGWIL